MVEVFDCPYISKVNNKQFQQDLIKYTKETKCCDEENCNHPKIQSDLKIDRAFPVIDNSINNLFKSYLGTDKFEFTKKNVWSYYAPKGSQLQNVIHNHMFKKEKGLQLSGLMYVTPTELGTKKVTSLNSTAVSNEFELDIAPSNLAPRPASPASNP